MRVNSDSGRFFNTRQLSGCLLIVVLPLVFTITSAFTEHLPYDLQKKQINLVIRQIGHRILLQAGNSTSRVLPVTENKAGTFLLQFEHDFVFDHDSLIALSLDLLPKTYFPSGYTVTVHDCLKADIVYGFQISNTSADVIACTGRKEPPGCYTIEFAFPDFYPEAEPQKVEREKGIRKNIAEQNKAAHDVIAEEPQSVIIDSQQSTAKQEGVQPTPSGFPVMNLVYGSVVVVLSVTLLIGRLGKKVNLPAQQPTTTRKNEIAEFATLGKFSFDVKGQRLLLGSEMISLTDKECKVLALLYQRFGELIPRETLMQEIWINEGVITGRSLDMFVSKLRKKLSGDPELRITNVHGKGYKLERSTATQL